MGKLKHAALERNTERRRSSVEMIMGHIQTISSRVTFKDKYAGPSDRPAGSSGEAGGASGTPLSPGGYRSPEVASRSAELRAQREERDAELKERLVQWFEKYDEDASGLLERSELRLLLKEAQPDEPIPPDDVVDELIRLCLNERHATAGGGMGITVDEIVIVVARCASSSQQSGRAV